MSETIKIASIDDAGRLRPVDKDHAALIAASVEQGRLEQPIIVRPVADALKPYKLTAGAHRLSALRDFLGWTELVVGEHVIVREQDTLDAELSEIDENLTRHELNALDRAFFMAERKRVYIEINRVRTQGGDRKSNKFKAEIKSKTLGFDFERFSANAAKRLRLSEEAVRLAVRIAEKIDRTAAATIRGTLIETNQQELLAFVDQPPDEQLKTAAALQAGEVRTVAQARAKLGFSGPVATDDPQAVILAKATVLIEKATPFTKGRLADLLWSLLDGKTRKNIFDRYETF